MKISELHEMQKKLDKHIEKEKGLHDVDLLPYMILGAQVELGEAANEWRYFKVWSNDREPRENLLEELVDALHFILSFGWRTGLEKYFFGGELEYRHQDNEDAMYYFNRLFSKVGDFYDVPTKWNYKEITLTFQNLVYSLGFTWDQVVDAYLAKNEINHERQDNGY